MVSYADCASGATEVEPSISRCGSRYRRASCPLASVPVTVSGTPIAGALVFTAFGFLFGPLGLNLLVLEVDAQDQRGFFVTPVSREDLIEIANLRVLLECHALRLSVEKGDTDWEGNLVAAHHKLHLMEQKMLAGDESQKEDWKRYDWEFHKALIEACGSRNLLSLHAVLYDKYLRYQMLVLTYRGEEAVEEHRQMFEQALARDKEASAATLKRHIEKGLEHTLAAF